MSDGNMVRLYGKGAVVLTDDRASYHASGGVITVPLRFVSKLLELGFSRTPPAVPSSAPTPVAPAAPVLTEPQIGELTAADLAILAAAEEEERQVQYRELVDGGLSEAEATELVWPQSVEPAQPPVGAE